MMPLCRGHELPQRRHRRTGGVVPDLGILSGEDGILLGNFPQAFTRIGAINAAFDLAEAQRRAAEA
ncbi:MAG: hypothetical protein HC923_02265 [Myxococcales bacterium]|nr:hypothetical protein [Myxococcales bacterium]